MHLTRLPQLMDLLSSPNLAHDQVVKTGQVKVSIIIVANLFHSSATMILSSGGGGGGEASPPKFSASPPKPFAIINCLILKCAILSKILVECYMKTAKNGQCARRHFSPKPKFLDRTPATYRCLPLVSATYMCLPRTCICHTPVLPHTCVCHIHVSVTYLCLPCTCVCHIHVSATSAMPYILWQRQVENELSELRIAFLPPSTQTGFHLGFFVWGKDCVQRSIVCEACKVFEPIFEYQSPMHEKT